MTRYHLTDTETGDVTRLTTVQLATIQAAVMFYGESCARATGSGENDVVLSWCTEIYSALKPLVNNAKLPEHRDPTTTPEQTP